MHMILQLSACLESRVLSLRKALAAFDETMGQMAQEIATKEARLQELDAELVKRANT